MLNRVIGKGEAEGVVGSGAGALEPSMVEWNKGDNVESKSRRRQLSVIRGDGFAIISSNQMVNIWWHVNNWEIVHTFVEACMGGNLDAGRLEVMPENVASGVGNTAKEDAFSRIGFEFSTTRT